MTEDTSHQSTKYTSDHLWRMRRPGRPESSEPSSRTHRSCSKSLFLPLNPQAGPAWPLGAVGGRAGLEPVTWPSGGRLSSEPGWALHPRSQALPGATCCPTGPGTQEARHRRAPRAEPRWGSQAESLTGLA